MKNISHMKYQLLQNIKKVGWKLIMENMNNPKELELAMKVLRDSFKADKTPGSYYHIFLSSLAKCIYENSNLSVFTSEDIAVKFLKRFTSDL